jgi:hypothetical protein
MAALIAPRSLNCRLTALLWLPLGPQFDFVYPKTHHHYGNLQKISHGPCCSERTQTCCAENDLA